MEPSSTILIRLANAIELTEAMAKEHPNKAPWPTLLSLLRSYDGMVRDHWPLTIEEEESCRLGWFSARNIEEAFPDLHGMLSDIAYSLRHGSD